jgi:hypothetical protein
MIVSFPAAAAAQFTTFIPPQNKVADSVKTAVAVEQKARTDSSVNMQLTNMKTWVDSAAGVVSAPRTAADSLADSLPVSKVAGVDSVALRGGARAPETASDLPLLALIGATALGIGALLLGAGAKSWERTDA